MLPGDERPHLGLGIGAGADLQRAHPRHQLVHQPVADPADRDRDRHRHAALAGRAVGGAHQRVDRLVEIGVGHHDHVVLGAAQRLHALAVLPRRSRRCIRRSRVEPTKLTASTSGWCRIASTASLSPLTTLNTPGGSPASSSSSAMRNAGRRVALRRLQHEGVAAGERHREHPHRHHRREVERRDAGADAERLAHRPAVDAAPDLLGELALQQMRDAAGELDDLDAARDLALRVGEHLAVLGGDRCGPARRARGRAVRRNLNMTRARVSGGVAAQAGNAARAARTA